MIIRKYPSRTRSFAGIGRLRIYIKIPITLQKSDWDYIFVSLQDCNKHILQASSSLMPQPVPLPQKLLPPRPLAPQPQELSPQQEPALLSQPRPALALPQQQLLQEA